MKVTIIQAGFIIIYPLFSDSFLYSDFKKHICACVWTVKKMSWALCLVTTLAPLTVLPKTPSLFRNREPFGFAFPLTKNLSGAGQRAEGDGSSVLC